MPQGAILGENGYTIDLNRVNVVNNQELQYLDVLHHPSSLHRHFLNAILRS